jgi:hypothetical protein
LQLGYFKARQLFFSFSLEQVEEDVRFIRARYFSDILLTDLEITKVTRLKQQRLILELCGYRHCGAKERRQLDVKARQAAMIIAKPVYIFRELIHYLAKQRIVMPGYSSLQDTVSRALSHEQARLIALVQAQLKPFDVEALQQLLADTEGLYEVTQLKREPKDFSVTEIKREIARGERLSHLYWLARALLPELKISNESIKYYASLVGYYSVYRLKALNEWMVYLYLLCFAFHRYQRLHDNLIQCLIYNVRRFSDEAKAAAKERVYELRIENNQNLCKAGQVLKLFTDEEIAENTPFENVQARAFAILARPKLEYIADHIVRQVSFDETTFQWEYLDQLAGRNRSPPP